MKVFQKIRHFFGFHCPLDCIETGEFKFEFQSPFDIYITKYTQYKCNRCDRKFFMTKYSFEEWKDEYLYKKAIKTVKMLKRMSKPLQIIFDKLGDKENK